jgi:hypothetical protein
MCVGIRLAIARQSGAKQHSISFEPLHQQKVQAIAQNYFALYNFDVFAYVTSAHTVCQASLLNNS